MPGESPGVWGAQRRVESREGVQRGFLVAVWLSFGAVAPEERETQRRVQAGSLVSPGALPSPPLKKKKKKKKKKKLLLGTFLVVQWLRLRGLCRESEFVRWSGN